MTVTDPSRSAPAGGRRSERNGDELEQLDLVLEQLDRVVIAFSGGADSAFLAHRANEVLGPERSHCVTAVSASLAPEELESCGALAAEWGLSWEPVETFELARPEYVLNDLDRCYHCKSELMDALAPIAHRRSATVVLGVNVDDLGEYRPGQRAAAERGAAFPLVDSGLTKARIRGLSAQLGLLTWDKPAAPCLASRVPHGTGVTAALLGQVAAAESALRALGFRDLRVRHFGETARVEIAPDELGGAVERREEVVAAVRDAGYREVTLDLEGLRPGNLTRAALGAGTPITLRRRHS